MPLEKPGLAFEDEELSRIKNGVESWVDPNVGNVFEERDLDFVGLDSWNEKFSSFIEKSKKEIEPYFVSGHGQLIFNEIIRSLNYIGSSGDRYHFKKFYSNPNDGSFDMFQDDYLEIEQEQRDAEEEAAAEEETETEEAADSGDSVPFFYFPGMFSDDE